MKKVQIVLSFILSIFLILSQSAIFAHNRSSDAFDEILQNEAYCIKAYDTDKIYIMPEVIHTTETGIFIEVQDREFVSIPYLQGDSFGCYIPLATGIEIFNKCPRCGRTYFVRCKNPECPSNK